MTSLLTILLPLKGRHLHTLRFLFHADRAKLPYHFLIADGEVHPAIARILENPKAAFPNLDIEYIRYPNDASYSDFYRKMADASARVRTPYVMQVDNDDFLIGSGIEHCIHALGANPEYASYGGGVGGFELKTGPEAPLKKVVGSLVRVSFRWLKEYAPRDDAAPSVAQRIRNAFDCIHTTYYNVFRTEALLIVHRELAELDLTDLQLHEVYFGMRVVSLGKARSDGTTMTYMRQAGTGTVTPERADWAKHLVRGRFTTDLSVVSERMSKVVAANETLDIAGFAEELRELFGTRLAAYLRGYYGAMGVRARPTDNIRKFIRALLPKKFVSTIQRNRSREYVYAALQSAGVNADGIATFRHEWTEIETLCEGKAFVSFVQRHAPELLAVSQDDHLGA